jgi:hypothetical protein
LLRQRKQGNRGAVGFEASARLMGGWGGSGLVARHSDFDHLNCG